MNRTLEVAVVGAGRMGQARVQAAKDFGAHVRYICDTDLERAERASAELVGCHAVLSHQEFDWKSLDAVLICTPPSERGAVELAAIEHRVPFLMEKPAGLSADAVSAIECALQKSPVLTAVGYMNRYRKSVQILRERVAGATILGMSADWLVGMYGVPWWSSKTGSGGPLNEQATHLVDLARYLVGEVASVQALAVPLPNHPDLIGTATINLQFRSGQMCSMLYSCQATEKMIRLHVYLEDADVVLSGWDFRLAGDDSTQVAYADRNQIFSTETQAFLTSTQTGDATHILCDFKDALATQRVVDAIHKAVETGATEYITPIA